MPTSPPQSAPPGPTVGLVPSAGHASRLGQLPCSKEILPTNIGDPRSNRPRVACEFVLNEMRKAGAERAYLVLRDGKWDIPSYLGDGHDLGLPLGYLMMRLPYGVPYTLDQATPFVEDATILLGFPDIMFEANTPVYPRLLNELYETGADAVLGLFPTDRPEKGDMVEIDDEGQVQSITIKSETPPVQTGWITAVWAPSFTAFLHEKIGSRSSLEEENQEEFQMGEVFLSAITEGKDIRGVPFPDGGYIDIGTPDELASYASGRWKKSPEYQ